MYAKLSLVLFAATSVFGAVTVKRGDGYGDRHGHGDHNGDGSCNAGQTACCDTIQQPNTTGWQDLADGLLSSGLLSSLGIGAQGLTVPLGANCIPITAVGAQIGQNCQTAVTCCDHVTSNGLIGVNCTPLNLNL